MPVIQLTTRIAAPAVTCFDLSRSIDLHMQSMVHTGETAIGGTTSGLINLGETVTWSARHFGIRFRMTSKITSYEYPIYFVDEMIKGPFKRLHHIHKFEQNSGYTIMTDTFDYASPGGILGSIVDALFLKKYMTRFLEHRNRVIKDVAEDSLSF